MDFFVPWQSSSVEYVEKKSRFLGYVRLVPTNEAAVNTLAAIRAEHPAASHHVYAYSVRADNAVRYSDDGEPHGTAGQPVLEVFKREKMNDYLCVVVRYFGGILLGAGGLIRAYAGTAKLALDTARKARLESYCTGLLECPYPLLLQVRRLLAVNKITEEGVSYGPAARLTISLPAAHWDDLSGRLAELSAGSLSPEHVETTERPVLVSHG